MSESDFEPIAIYQGTASQAWFAAFQDRDHWQSEESRAGLTYERFRAGFHLSDPRQRWVGTRLPPMNVAFAIAECCWIVCGDERLAYLSPWCGRYKKYVGDAPAVYGAYGKRLRKAFGCDQLAAAGLALREDPSTRQVVLQTYHPGTDMPTDSGLPRARDIPCNVSALLKVRAGRLEWSQVMRSNDLCKGTPYNFVQFTTLQEVIAGLAECEVGSYFHYADSLHMYTEDADEGRFEGDGDLSVPINEDDLRLPMNSCFLVWGALHRMLEEIADCPDAAQVADRASGSDLPLAFQSLLLVCASERLRRMGAASESQRVLASCQNACLAAMQRAWAGRYAIE